MIDITKERLVTTSQAAKLRPPGRMDRPTHITTVYRWIKNGVRGVKLEAIRIGGTLYTSHEALQKFAERLTAKEDMAVSTPVLASPASRRRASERAERLLDRLGF